MPRPAIMSFAISKGKGETDLFVDDLTVASSIHLPTHKLTTNMQPKYSVLLILSSNVILVLFIYLFLLFVISIFVRSFISD